MLFLLIMEVLKRLLQASILRGNAAPAPLQYREVKHRASLYADDVVIFLAPTELDLNSGIPLHGSSRRLSKKYGRSYGVARTKLTRASSWKHGTWSPGRWNMAGLGIVNLRIMGCALRLGWVWESQNPHSCWAGLPNKKE